MKRLLSFLSGHFKSLDGQQCLEFLIQKYQVHVYNGEDLILFALPFHDTPLFGTLVKLITFLDNAERGNASETRWTFLRNVHKTGSPLSRLALVRMCRSSQPVMTAIIEHTIDSLKYGAFNQPLLSFVNVLLLEVLSDFNSIKYDISISLFSLCRICFKAAKDCISAFFVGLSVSTHIVCVANVRDDALTLLLTRAISVCPANKFHALLMGFAVVAARRGSLPEGVVDAINQVDGTLLRKAVDECIQTLNADLSALGAASPLIANLVIEASTAAAAKQHDQESAAPQVAPVVEEKMSSSEDDDSSSDDELGPVRRILTGLVAKGTRESRLAAIEKYASVEGSTRHCIRLSAMCDSVESLALTMKHAQKDQGFVPTLISVLPLFKKSSPQAIIEAVFLQLPKIPTGAIRAVANELGASYAGSLVAVAREIEDEFILSGDVWKAIACVCAGPTTQLGKTVMVSEWRTRLMPSGGFLHSKLSTKEDVLRFAETFIEYANNPKVVVGGDLEGSSLTGALVCSLAIPNSSIRKALGGYVAQMLSSLSDTNRTAAVVEIVNSGSLALVKKLNELGVSGVDVDSESLKACCRSLTMDGGSVESWTLLKTLVDCGLVIDWHSCIASMALGSKSGPIACAAWKCLSVSRCSETFPEIINLVVKRLGESQSAVPMETNVMLETLLSLITLSEISTVVEPDLVSQLVTHLVGLVVRGDATISDSLISTAQSVCEALVVRTDFNKAWPMLLRVMADPIFADNLMGVQIRCMQLLSALIARDDVDSETLTSKELGQVTLGLVDLISGSAVTPFDSWRNLSNSEEELSFAIEKSVTGFLLSCTLKKLDRFFRRLVECGKPATVLRVYSSVCGQGGEAVTLALLPTVSDLIRSSLSDSTAAGSKKRKRDLDLVLAGLGAVSASCVEQVPEDNLSELIESAASVAGTVEDVGAVARACGSIVRVASSDQIKSFTKLLMQRTTDSSAPFVQESIVRIVLALWKSNGEVMVPAITEVTMYLHELFNSSESEVAAATSALVKEIDRITGEDIESKLTGADGDMSD